MKKIFFIFLAITLLNFSYSLEKPIQEGLILYLNFENTQENVTKDSSLNNNDAFCYSPSKICDVSEGKLGKGIHLDGKSFLYFKNNSFFNLNEGSIFLWVKTSGLSGYESLFSIKNSFGLFLFNKSPSISFWDYNKNVRVWKKIDKSINDNNWHLLGLTFENIFFSESSLNARVYLDGELIFITDLFSENKDLPFYIGTAEFLNYKFEGFLDEILVWNRSLSSQEVYYLYNRGEGRDLLFHKEDSFVKENPPFFPNENINSSEIKDKKCKISNFSFNKIYSCTSDKKRFSFEILNCSKEGVTLSFFYPENFSFNFLSFSLKNKVLFEEGASVYNLFSSCEDKELTLFFEEDSFFNCDNLFSFFLQKPSFFFNNYSFNLLFSNFSNLKNYSLYFKVFDNSSNLSFLLFFSSLQKSFEEFNDSIFLLLEKGLCEQRKLSFGESTKFVFLCKNPSFLNEGESKLFLWLSEDTLFKIHIFFCKDSLCNFSSYDLSQDIPSSLENFSFNSNFSNDLFFEDFLKKVLFFCPSTFNKEIKVSSFFCFFDPPFCPLNGKQKKICKKSISSLESEEVTFINCTPSSCEGCIVPKFFDSNNKCISVGEIIKIKNRPLYFKLLKVNPSEITLLLNDETFELEERKKYNLYEGKSLFLKNVLYFSSESFQKKALISLEDFDFYLSEGDSFFIPEDASFYCDFDGLFKPQKKFKENCKNDFECESNSCIKGICEINSSSNFFLDFLCKIKKFFYKKTIC